MSLSTTKRFLKVAQILAAAAALLALFALPATTQQGASNTNWPSYGSDRGNTRYSPLTQIDAGNFSKLQPAWIFSTASFGPTPETNLESTPLVIDGVLYSTVGDRRDVVALDAATGEVLWTHREDEGKRAHPIAGSFSAIRCQRQLARSCRECVSATHPLKGAFVASNVSSSPNAAAWRSGLMAPMAATTGGSSISRRVTA